MRYREVWPIAWAGLGLSLAAEVVYVTDLTIFTHLVSTASSRKLFRASLGCFRCNEILKLRNARHRVLHPQSPMPSWR